MHEVIDCIAMHRLEITFDNQYFSKLMHACQKPHQTGLNNLLLSFMRLSFVETSSALQTYLKSRSIVFLASPKSTKDCSISKLTAISRSKMSATVYNLMPKISEVEL